MPIYRNWRDAGEYSHLEGKPLPLSQIAWEFLRRNEKYQIDYSDKTVSLEKYYLAERVDPETDKFEIKYWRKPYSVAYGTYKDCTIKIKSWEAAIIVDQRFPLSKQVKKAIKDLELYIDINKIFGRPLPIVRPEIGSEYIRYLRVLDARKKAARPKDIGLNIFPNVSNNPDDRQRDRSVRDAIKAANDLCGGDYQKLVYRIFIPAPPPPKPKKS